MKYVRELSVVRLRFVYVRVSLLLGSLLYLLLIPFVLISRSAFPLSVSHLARACLAQVCVCLTNR